MSTAPPDGGPSESIELTKAAEYLIEECRMVLPGIQALFGFQLVAVFNSAFDEKLNLFERHLHLAAIGLVAVAVALIMTPAAYHRQTNPRGISEAFIRLSSRLLLASMFPLVLGMDIDFYLIARILLGGVWAPLLAVTLLSVFATLWFVLPRVRSLGRFLAR